MIQYYRQAQHVSSRFLHQILLEQEEFRRKEGMTAPSVVGCDAVEQAVPRASHRPPCRCSGLCAPGQLSAIDGELAHFPRHGPVTLTETTFAELDSRLVISGSVGSVRREGPLVTASAGPQAPKALGIRICNFRINGVLLTACCELLHRQAGFSDKPRCFIVPRRNSMKNICFVLPKNQAFCISSLI